MKSLPKSNKVKEMKTEEQVECINCFYYDKKECPPCSSHYSGFKPMNQNTKPKYYCNPLDHNSTLNASNRIINSQVIKEELGLNSQVISKDQSIKSTAKGGSLVTDTNVGIKNADHKWEEELESIVVEFVTKVCDRNEEGEVTAYSEEVMHDLVYHLKLTLSKAIKERDEEWKEKLKNNIFNEIKDSDVRFQCGFNSAVSRFNRIIYNLIKEGE